MMLKHGNRITFNSLAKYKIHNVKQILLGKENNTFMLPIFLADLNVYTYTANILEGTKSIFILYSKVLRRLNYSEEFFSQIYNFSNFPLMFFDINFYKIFIKNILKYLTLYREGLDIIQEKENFLDQENFINFVSFAIFIYFDLGNVNSVNFTNFILEDIFQKETIKENFILKLIIKNQEICGNSVAKISTKIKKKFQMSYFCKINHNREQQLKLLNSFYSTENVIQKIQMNLFNKNFVEENIMFMKFFVEEIANIFNIQNLELILNQLSNILSANRNFETFRNIRKIIVNLLSIFFKHKDSQICKSLLKFYIQKLLNFKIFLLSEINFNAKEENFISLLKIKQNIVFSINFEGGFRFSLIDSLKFIKVVEDLKKIFLEIQSEDKTKNKRKWWEKRYKLEDQLERQFFLLQKILFNDREMQTTLSKIFESNSNFNEILSKKYKNIEHNIEFIVKGLIQESNTDLKSDFYAKDHKFFKTFSDNLNPLYLITSSELSSIPLENLPVLYRFPIIRTLNYNIIKDEPFSFEINPTKDLYYLLNPTKDLKTTEKRLKNLFSKLNLNGLIKDAVKNVEKEVANKKLFLYCGHGRGSQHFDINYLKQNCFSCMSLLFGCSSAKIGSISSTNSEIIGATTFFQTSKW